MKRIDTAVTIERDDEPTWVAPTHRALLDAGITVIGHVPDGLLELFGVALHADHPPGPHDAAHRAAELTQATPHVQHAIAPIERQRLQRAVVQQLVE